MAEEEQAVEVEQVEEVACEDAGETTETPVTSTYVPYKSYFGGSTLHHGSYLGAYSRYGLGYSGLHGSGLYGSGLYGHGFGGGYGLPRSYVPYVAPVPVYSVKVEAKVEEAEVEEEVAEVKEECAPVMDEKVAETLRKSR